jgi:4-amino-4-deoxy-L-arabinose transferase-like glycosyltransferase
MIWSHLAILLLLLVVYLGSAFTPALMDDADSSHAEAAREMLVRADYVTLHVNGVRYLEKAPLMYWLIAFCYRIFGVNEFAARLPIVLSLLLSALLAMRWAGRAFGERAGLYAALFVGSTTGFFLFTRILIPEALLSLFIAAALYFFLTAMEDARTSGAAFAWRWYAGYACVALGVLTKGLIALVFVGAAACGYLLLSGEWRSWREFRLAGGIALLLAIAAPWHLLAGFRNHGFFWFYFVNEHFLRFLGKRYPKDYNKLPARLYWSLHLAWFFPWSMYLPSVVRDLWHTKLPGLKPRPGADSTLTFGARTRLLCWIWGGSILIFFSLSTNQEYYTFPAYLPILMLLAAAIAGQECESGGRGLILIWSAAAVAAVSLTAGIALSAGLWSSRHLPYVADIGTVLAKHNLSNDTLSMSHILDLTGESFAALRLPALIAIVALIVGPLLALVLRLRRRHQAATWITACAMALLFVAAHIALVRFEPYMSSRQMAQSIARQAGPDDQVMIYGDQAYGSSLLFYLRRPIDLVNGRTTTMWFGSTFPDAPKIYLDDSGLLQAWNSKRRVFLFVSPYMRARVDSLLTEPKYVVTEESGKIVYSNRPGS